MEEKLELEEYFQLGKELVDLVFERQCQTHGMLAFTREDLERLKEGKSSLAQKKCEEFWDHLMATQPFMKVQVHRWHRQ